MLWGEMETKPRGKKQSKGIENKFSKFKIGRTEGCDCVTAVLVKPGCTIYKISQIKCMCGVLLFKVMK